MNIGSIIAGLVVVAVVGYVLFGQDDLARAIRARLTFWKKQTTRVVDTVSARTSAAAVAQQRTVQYGRSSLFEVMKEEAAVELEVARIEQEVADDEAAMRQAREAKDRPTFNVLAEELARDQADLIAMREHLAMLQAERATLEGRVDDAKDKLRGVESLGRKMRAKARVADVTTLVDKAAAGLLDESADDEMAAAQRIVDEKLAEASAAARAAEGMTPNERAERKAEAYLDKARRPQVDAEALWNQMGGASAAEAEPDEPTPGA